MGLNERETGGLESAADLVGRILAVC